MASRCLEKIGIRAASRFFSPKQALQKAPFISTNGGLLVQHKFIHTSPRVGVNKGPEGAPPQRFISGTGHIGFYLIISAILVSYPTYLFYYLDEMRNRVYKDIGEEVKEEIQRRKELRAQGAMPVLQMVEK